MKMKKEKLKAVKRKCITKEEMDKKDFTEKKSNTS